MGENDEKLKENENLMTIEPAEVVKNEDSNEFKLASKAAVIQITYAVLANITIISSGIGIGYPAISLPLLNEQSIDIKLTVSKMSWFASITAISSPIGGLISGYLLEKLGRKSTLLCINVISILSWLIIGFSSRSDEIVLFTQLMIARFIIGIAIGMSSFAASVYAAEISHPSIRGRLTLLSAFCTALGMLLVYFLGYIISDNYRQVSLISAGFTFFSLIVLLPVSESPTWLVVKGKQIEARKALSKIRNYDENDYRIGREIENLENMSKMGMKDTKTSKLKEMTTRLKQPQLYKPLGIMIAFFAFQQFSGIFVIFVYAAQFSVQAGVTIDPLLSAVFIGLTRVITTILMAFISDKYGRKPPARFSGIGMCFSMLGLAACTKFNTKDTSFDWMPAFLMIFFIFSATLGFLTLPFSMIAELYPQQSRGLGAGITICAGYFMSFINIKAYPAMVENLGSFTIFLFYSFVSILGVFFVHFILIETKGKTLEEIEIHFREKRKPQSDVEMLSNQ